jgi:hypothetical protein
MPYFVFRIKPGIKRLAQTLDFQRECADFQEAKDLARSLRAAQPADDTATVRLVFAKDRIEAEELLSTPREQPILREWEK